MHVYYEGAREQRATHGEARATRRRTARVLVPQPGQRGTHRARADGSQRRVGVPGGGTRAGRSAGIEHADHGGLGGEGGVYDVSGVRDV